MKLNQIDLNCSCKKIQCKKFLINDLLFTYISICLFTLFSRPGVLILINENDWELEGGLDAELNANDSILFISTLHGG
jgi:hypothetical protein